MLSPTPLGEATCDALIAAFPDVMDYQFTAQVEDWLDDVSRGERDWVKALRDFYDPFAVALASAPPKMAAFKGAVSRNPAEVKPEAEVGERGKRRRQDLAAQALPPEFRRIASIAFTSSLEQETDRRRSECTHCPKCGSPMIKRTGPRGEFWGCSTFPKCKGTRNL